MPTNSDGELTASRDCVQVRKRHVPDRYSIPAIRFDVVSNCEEPVSVTVTDDVPAVFQLDVVGLPPKHDDHWRVRDDHRVEFTYELDPGEEFTTAYRIDVDEEDVQQFMSAPSITGFERLGSDDGDSSGLLDTVLDVVGGLLGGGDDEGETADAAGGTGGGSSAGGTSSGGTARTGEASGSGGSSRTGGRADPDSGAGTDTTTTGAAEAGTGPASADAGAGADTDTGPAGADTGPAGADTGPADASTGPADASTGPADTDAGPADTDTGPADASTGPADTDTGPAGADAGPADASTGPAGADSADAGAGPTVEAPDAAAVERAVAVADPAAPGRRAFHLRVGVPTGAGGPGTAGRQVFDALEDAFEVLGTNPSRDRIEAGDHGDSLAAVVAGEVDAERIERALDGLGVVTDYVVTEVTDRVDTRPEADTGAGAGTGDAGADAGAEGPRADAGTGAGAEAGPSVPTGADADGELVPERPDDAQAAFSTLQEEYSQVGTDELESELEGVSFGEFDDEDTMSVDDLIAEAGGGGDVTGPGPDAGAAAGGGTDAAAPAGGGAGPNAGTTGPDPGAAGSDAGTTGSDGTGAGNGATLPDEDEDIGVAAEPDDAQAAFADLQEQFSRVETDELEEELEDVTFGEFDDQDTMGVDDLIAEAEAATAGGEDGGGAEAGTDAAGAGGTDADAGPQFAPSGIGSGEVSEEDVEVEEFTVDDDEGVEGPDIDAGLIDEGNIGDIEVGDAPDPTLDPEADVGGGDDGAGGEGTTGVTVTEGGVTVEKSLVTFDRFDSAESAMMFQAELRIRSDRDLPVAVRVVDPLPESVGGSADIDWGDRDRDGWRAGDAEVRFEDRLVPGGTVETVYGFPITEFNDLDGYLVEPVVDRVEDATD